ncbi:predicted protein [Plenodomus lingam JN3]|uniref:Predicted protein n=1 Tax=Leptosphaeria maculans (strain JN3 / isolate v23.1.3 / race Av1-4-5-6-7-8) TaxID=985895 RepID=E5AED8_LEPMJ|nr:predicted protein [Plenodomus lingam JN3]CBY01577.1 predicted protein [Plenodomus lingam JN3]
MPISKKDRIQREHKKADKAGTRAPVKANGLPVKAPKPTSITRRLRSSKCKRHFDIRGALASYMPYPRAIRYTCTLSWTRFDYAGLIPQARITSYALASDVASNDIETSLAAVSQSVSVGTTHYKRLPCCGLDAVYKIQQDDSHLFSSPLVCDSQRNNVRACLARLRSIGTGERIRDADMGTPASPVRCQHTLTYQKISSRMDIKTCCLIWISFTDLSSFARAVSVFDHPSRAKVPDLQHITAERHLSHGYWRDTRCRRTGPDYCILNNIRFQVVRICIAQNPNLFHVNKFAFSSHRSCCSPLRLNPGNCLLAGWLVEVIACSLVPSY